MHLRNKQQHNYEFIGTAVNVANINRIVVSWTPRIVEYCICFQGLHPESHGIVENNMFDLKINRTFKLGSPNAFDTRWWGGEPVSII